jgi:predicted flap endonuclease-1-like 5' DNA nuclease
MWTVAEFNLVPILVGLLIGFIVGFWIFRAVRRSSGGAAAHDVTADAPAAALDSQPPEPPPAVVRRPIRDGIDTVEGRGVAGEAATATRNVAGEILGVGSQQDLPSTGGPPDNLQMLKGVGPKLAAQLAENGIVRFDQLARLSANEVEMLDAKLGAFRGRIARDRLVEQAAFLARGDTDGFEARFGKLGGGTLQPPGR